MAKKEKRKAVVHIYSSVNNVIVHVTDQTGAETLSRVSGGMITDKDHLQGKAYPAMQAAERAIKKARSLGIDKIDIKVRGPGGHHKFRNPGPGAQPAIRAIARTGIDIGKIEDVTPLPSNGGRPKGGRKGRRL